MSAAMTWIALVGLGVITVITRGFFMIGDQPSDIEAARRAHRLALRAGIGERIARVADFLPIAGGPAQTAAPPEPPSRARTRLRLYEEDD